MKYLHKKNLRNSVDEEEKNKMDDNASGILRCGILLDAFCFQKTFITKDTHAI